MRTFYPISGRVDNLPSHATRVGKTPSLAGVMRVSVSLRGQLSLVDVSCVPSSWVRAGRVRLRVQGRHA